MEDGIKFQILSGELYVHQCVRDCNNKCIKKSECIWEVLYVQHEGKKTCHLSENCVFKQIVAAWTRLQNF